MQIVITLRKIRYIVDCPTDLNLLGEGGTEHHGLADAFRWHCILLHNASDLWLKTHVQHAVSLIQDQEAGETNFKFNYKS